MSDRLAEKLTRFRRWLAYKLLPGTNEFDVAQARQHALFQLQRSYDKIPDLERSRSIETAFETLRDRVPVREEWDNFANSEVDRHGGK